MLALNQSLQAFTELSMVMALNQYSQVSLEHQMKPTKHFTVMALNKPKLFNK